MKLGAIENKARLTMVLFVLALLLTIGLSLALYSQARTELANERIKHLRLETALIHTRLEAAEVPPTDESLKELLVRNRISGFAAVFDVAGSQVATASTFDRSPPIDLRPISRQNVPTDQRLPVASEARLGSQSGYDIAEISGSKFVVMLAQLGSESASTVIVYVFSYQIVALVCGLALLYLLARWLLRPYNRMVEAARGSPVHPLSAPTESEFVVQTFQALIEQLQKKEQELALLHAAERMRAERSERFSERLIANIPSGLVAVSSTGLVTSANTQAHEIFGAGGPTTQPLIRRDLDESLASNPIRYEDFFGDAPGLIGMVSRTLAEGVSFRREETDVTYADGRVRHLGLSVSPITDASSRIEGALCMMTDLTEVIELRERMKLQDNLANLGEMAAGLAHEFKNSLATIHGFVQLLDAQASQPTDQQRGTLEATLNEVRLLTRLVTDFLNFARPQQLNLAPLDLKVLIEESRDEIKPLLEKCQICCEIKGVFPVLAGDESMLRRAFVNLLRNAAEAIEDQSETRRIEIEGSADEGRDPRYAHVRISDTGSGISEGDLHHIFIPFFTTKSRGYGIGLAIVQKIIVAHGGNVSVERSNSSGTTFHCRLPM